MEEIVSSSGEAGDVEEQESSVNSAWSANAVLRIASRRLEFTTSTCNVKLPAARAQHAGQSLITFEMPDASQVLGLLPLAARSFTISWGLSYMVGACMPYAIMI